jgi:hypothetical protein
MSENKIMIIRESVRESWLIDGGTFLACLAIMVLSRLMDSQAMGWLGFVALLVVAIGRMTNAAKKRYYTISEARAELDRIEKAI